MRTYLSLVLVMAFWGSAFPSSKIAVQSAPPEVAAFVRFLLGAAVLVALGGLRRLPVRDVAAVTGLGLVGCSATTCCSSPRSRWPRPPTAA